MRQSLTEEERQSLGSLATHVMSYLEINREAIEGRRAKRLSDGLNHFIEGKSSYPEPSVAAGRLGESNTRKHYHLDSEVRKRGSDLSCSSSEDENLAGCEGSQRR